MHSTILHLMSFPINHARQMFHKSKYVKVTYYNPTKSGITFFFVFKFLCFYLFICRQYYSKTKGDILMKFCGLRGNGHGMSLLNLGGKVRMVVWIWDSTTIPSHGKQNEDIMIGGRCDAYLVTIIISFFFSNLFIFLLLFYIIWREELSLCSLFTTADTISI